MKNLFEASEHDPMKDEFTKEDWVICGIIAPMLLVVILGFAEAVARLFG